MNNYALFPFGKIERNSNVVIYGAGLVGQNFYRQIETTGYCKLAFFVDRNYDKISIGGAELKDLDALKNTANYDYIVIGILDDSVKYAVQEQLLSMGIPSNKIIVPVNNELNWELRGLSPKNENVLYSSQIERDEKKIRWGIIGTGFIAKLFAKGLMYAPGAELFAVSSRNMEKAREFATGFGVKKFYGSRDDMLADSEIDIIYVATPNHCHASDSIVALNSGKAVLCEKPFALSSSELENIITVARKKNVFLMEALWTNFLPSFRKFVELANSGAIGEPLLLQADFGYASPFDMEKWRHDPAQGGGSIYDLGVYTLFAAMKIFGKPEKLETIKIPSPSGTDLTAVIQTLHENGKLAMLASSFAMELDTEAKLYGTKGKLTLHRMFLIPTKLTLQNENGLKVFAFNEPSNGYQYEAIAAMNAIRCGLTECPEWNLNDSRILMELLDKANDIKPTAYLKEAN
jgi:predicted dehydrogenase